MSDLKFNTPSLWVGIIYGVVITHKGPFSDAPFLIAAAYAIMINCAGLLFFNVVFELIDKASEKIEHIRKGEAS
jgi:hypothetical protein